MAFFGADGLEHQIKQLKAVIAQKDSQLTTLLNEQHKKGELFDENKRTRDDALYRVQSEADRAEKAEKALAIKTAELSTTLIKLSNAESTVNANNEKSKKDEKEIERLQYELDSRLQNSSTSQSRVQEAHSALQAKIKSLEAQLQRVEAEKESLKVDASFADRNAAFKGHGAGGEREKDTVSGLERLVADLREENIKLIEEHRKNANCADVPPQAAVIRSSEVSKRRRRSLSFNGDSRIQQLQDEVDTLRDQLSRGADYAEVDKLKESLAIIKKKSLKLENEKMALERSTKKAIEEMQSQLEANNEELEYLRHNGGEQASQELDTLKKTAQREKAALEGRIASLKDELASKTDSLARIEKRLEAMEAELEVSQTSLTAAQEAEARAFQEIQSLKQRPHVDDTGVKESLTTAQKKIDSLQEELSGAERRLDKMSEELAQAKATASLDRTNTPPESTASSSAAHFEKTIRQLQREVSALTREKEALQASLQENDELLAEKDEEIFALRTKIPMPPSPGSSSRDDNSAAVAELTQALVEKTAELDSLQQQKVKLQEELRQQAAQAAELSDRVQILQEALEMAKSDDAQDKREEIEGELHRAQQELQVKEEQLLSLASESTDRQQQIETLMEVAYSVKLVEEEKSSLQATVEGLEIRMAALARTEVELEEARSELETRSFSDADVDAIIARSTQLEAEINQLRETVKTLEAEEFVARRGKEAALEHVSRLEGSIKALEEQLIHDEEVFDKIISELKEDKANMDIGLTKAKDEQESLKSQLQEVQDTIANRSSATEAGEREMAVLQAQSREADLQSTVKQLQAEIESNEGVAKMATEAAERDNAQLRKEIEALRTEHASSVGTVESLRVTIGNLEDQIQKMSFEIKEASDIAQQLADVKTTLSTVSESEQKRSREIELQLAIIHELREELDEQNRVLEFAEVEYATLLEASRSQQRTHESAVTDLEERLIMSTTQAKSERDDIVVAAEQAKGVIQDELTTLRANLSVIELSLQESTDSLQASEDRAGKLRSLLQEREKEVLRLKTSMAETGQPIDATVLKLREEVNSLEARIERRNRQIALEQERARKLTMNLQLAQDTVEEQDAALQESRRTLSVVEEARLSLEAQVESLNEERSGLVDAVQRLTDDASIQGRRFEQALAEHRDELLQVTDTQTQLVIQLLIHRQKGERTSQAAIRKVLQMTSKLSEANAMVQQLETSHQEALQQLVQTRMKQEDSLTSVQDEKIDLDDKLCAMRIVLLKVTDERQKLQVSSLQSVEEMKVVTEKHRAEMGVVQEEMEDVQNKAQQLSQTVDAIELEKESLIRQSQTVESELNRLQQLLAHTTAQLKEKQSALEAMQVAGGHQDDLAVELQNVKEECLAAQQQIEAMTTELATANDQYRINQKTLQENAALLLAKEGAEEEMARRTLERDALRTEKENLLKESEELHEAITRMQRLTEMSEHNLRLKIEEEQLTRAETEHRLRLISDQVTQLQASLDHSTRCHEQLTLDLERARVSLASTESQNERIQSDFSAAEQQRVASESRLSDLQDSISMLQESKAALLTENETFRIELATRLEELAYLRVKLEERQNDVETLRAGKPVVSDAKEEELEETKQELERERNQRCSTAIELQGVHQELDNAKAALLAKTAELQSLIARQHESEKLLSELRQAVSALLQDRDKFAAEVAELSDEKQDLNARLESMNNEMEEHMENVREAQKAKTSAQRKLEKLERKLKALTVSANVAVSEPPTTAAFTNTVTPSAKTGRQMPSNDVAQVVPQSSGRKRGRETDHTGAVATPTAVFAPSPFERARSPIKQLPGGRTAFTPNRTPNRHMLVPTDENLGSKPSVFTPKMRILSDPASYTKTTPSTLGEEKLATLRTKLADMRTLNM